MAPTELAGKREELTPEWRGSVWPSWRWFDQLFRDGDGLRMITIEEFTEGDALVVRAEIPGIDPDKDVQISVADGMLQITAERTEKEEKTGRHFHRSELRYGSFGRGIPLPKGVDGATVTAEYKDGMLEVRVPLPAGSTEVSTRRVPVVRK